jgi:hypothetical protein
LESLGTSRQLSLGAFSCGRLRAKLGHVRLGLFKTRQNKVKETLHLQSDSDFVATGDPMC